MAPSLPVKLGQFRFTWSHKYQALPDQYAFRYLELLPNKEAAEMRYRLRVVRGNVVRVGRPNVKVPSICDGKLLEITRSLREGLWHLLYRDRKRLLWADEICINQEDISEKSQQVM